MDSLDSTGAASPAFGSTRQLRVLHVVEAYGGGVLTAVNQLVNDLARESHDVVLVHGLRPETPEDFPALLAPSIRCIALPMTRRIAPLSDLRALIALWRLLRRERPDVVHLHSSKAGFLGRLAARLAGHRNVFYSPHGFAFQGAHQGARLRATYRVLERLAARFSDATVVACSESEKTLALDVARRVALVENAVNPQELERVAPAAHERSPRIPTVAALGRTDPVKRPELFAQVARLVREHAGVPVRFLWIGGGRHAFDADAGVEQTGWLPRDMALRRLADEVDVLLQTSACEGLPMSVLEAKAFGVPAVVTDVPGNRCAVAQGVSGFVRPDHAHALAEAVTRLIRAPALRERMARAAREEARTRFSNTRSLRDWLALYRAGLPRT
jgi:glycosyltransferase involved in cell wall biosynthesis